MSEWVDVCAVGALADGEHVNVLLEDDAEVAVFKLDGEFYAIRDRCTHQNLPLAEGEIDGDEIICPFHGARFCLKTGQAKSPPAYEDLDTYAVRICEERLQVASSTV